MLVAANCGSVPEMAISSAIFIDAKSDKKKNSRYLTCQISAIKLRQDSAKIAVFLQLGSKLATT